MPSHNNQKMDCGSLAPLSTTCIFPLYCGDQFNLHRKPGTWMIPLTNRKTV
jgi:hypothetical protein